MTLVRARGDAASDEADARYEDDPFTWALQQAAFLRQGSFGRVDASNLADEIESLTHYLADKLEGDLVRVLQHLLKWDHQPKRRGTSWVLTIAEHRRRVMRHLGKAPGLRSILDETVQDAFQTARTEMLKETKLPPNSIPSACPYDWDAIMHHAIAWPDPAATA